MTRIPVLTISAAALVATLAACNQTPAPTAVAAGSAAPASVAAGPVVVTYQCHSDQKSRDIFLRFGADGALYLGADAADMKPTGDVVLFGTSGVATWSKKQGTWTESNRFDKNKGVWDWTNDPGPGGVADVAHYSCKPV